MRKPPQKKQLPMKRSHRQRITASLPKCHTIIIRRNMLRSWKAASSIPVKIPCPHSRQMLIRLPTPISAE